VLGTGAEDPVGAAGAGPRAVAGGSLEQKGQRCSVPGHPGGSLLPAGVTAPGERQVQGFKAIYEKERFGALPQVAGSGIRETI